jgi:hypothetical protein
MRFLPLPPWLTVLLIASFSLALGGCRNNDRQDTLIASAANPSHTWRATVILRQYFVDGKVDTSPTTYVLLDKDMGKPGYGNGEEFKDSQVVMKPSQCGPLNVRWTDDHLLKVVCEKCGLALTAVGPHSSGADGIRIEYEGFPDRSSWETGPGAN